MKANKLLVGVFISSLMLGMVGCGGGSSSSGEVGTGGGSSSSGSNTTGATDTTGGGKVEPMSFKVTGDISCTKKGSGALELSRLPVSLKEFKELYDKVAVQPQGAAAMYAVALKVYNKYPTSWGRDAFLYTRNDGGRIEGELLDRVGEGLVKGRIGSGKASEKPWIANAYFQGATPANGYTPSKPYVVNVKFAKAKKCELLSRYNQKVWPLQVQTYGGIGKDPNKQNRWHNLAVVKAPSKANIKQYLAYGADAGDMMMEPIRPMP